MDTIRELLALSQKEQKGVQIYVNGQAIGLVVTKMEGDFVEGKNRESSRIVVRVDRIDAVTKA
jgi:hypothetical protein